MDNIITILLIVMVFGFWLILIKKMIWNKVAPVKIVKAKVVDKYKTNLVSRYHGTFKQESYVVVFGTKDKKLSFNVSEFSYCNYKIKEEGMLKYKGTKIISFQ